LIKIISEKEKTIEKYKRSAKHQEKELKMSQNNQLNLFDEKLKEDINTTNLEVRAIQAKMQFMENRIEELTQVLNEEVAINTLYEDKIKTLQTNEQQFQEQIQLLEEDLQQ
jgi:chaperonin cofactor prefoldin